MIVILGATGKAGGAAAGELRRRGVGVRAVVRDAARAGQLARDGCEIAVADLHDQGALERALRGADGLLALCPPDPAASDVLADAALVIEAVAGAIEAARPRVVVAISDYGAQHPAGTGITGIFHRLERRFGALPAAVTLLRSAEHMQNWKRQLPTAKARGFLPSLHHPLSRRFAAVSAPDVGVVAAELLAAPPEAPHATPRVIHVEGPRRYSADDMAEGLARLAGRPVAALLLERARWAEALDAAGLGGSYARLVAELQDAHNAGLIDVEAGRGEVRRCPTELDAALAL